MPRPAIQLKLAPPLHDDLAAVKLAVGVLVTATLDLAVRLPCVAPGKVVKLPECVDGQDKVPHGQRAEIDEHPKDIRPAVGGENDEDRWEAKDEG